MDSFNYWMQELSNRAEGTRLKYQGYFQRFIEYTGKSADELLEQRKQDLKSEDLREQRAIESLLTGFIAKLDKEGNSPATQQVAYAAVRSFFEINYMPLRMRRGSYPNGESIGQRAATKEVIRKILANSKSMKDSLKIKAIILTLKDSGLRVSDLATLNYGDVAEALESELEFFSLTRVTKKQRTVAHTFLGSESLQALRDYIQERREGTRRIPPEEITKDSPLFRTNEGAEVKRLSRSGLSSMIAFHFQKISEKNLSAHSFRKFLQTGLEAAGINSNWIDQIIGHKLINSRDAYSRPSNEQLKEVYMKAYPNLRVLKSAELEDRIKDLETQLEEKDILIRGLMTNGNSKSNEIAELKAKVSEFSPEKIEQISSNIFKKSWQDFGMKMLETSFEEYKRQIEKEKSKIDKAKS